MMRGLKGWEVLGKREIPGPLEIQRVSQLISVTPVNRGDSTGTTGLQKVQTMKQWKGTGSARASILEKNIFVDGNPVWRLYGLGGSGQLMPPDGQVEGRVFPENRERARTSESKSLTSVSGLCLPFASCGIWSKWLYLSKHPALHLWSEKWWYLSQNCGEE